ncbi:MAG: MBL fold metallo-hydrolase [Pseudomonadota bacterium]
MNRILLLVLLVPQSACLAHESQSPATSSQATYIANAGVMVSHGDLKVMFDPFFRDGFGVYDLVPAAMEAAILAGEVPYDGIDALFVSHYHGDHFDPLTVLNYLQRWPDVHLYAPEQALRVLSDRRAEDIPEVWSRVHGIQLQRDSAAVVFETDQFVVEAIRIAHAGWPDRHADVENIAYRVTLDEITTVVHLGDADAGKQHYEPHQEFWQSRKTDVAFVPVWLMLTDKGRHVLNQHVEAASEIGIHVYKNVAKDPAIRDEKFDGIDLFTEPGETRMIK